MNPITSKSLLAASLALAATALSAAPPVERGEGTPKRTQSATHKTSPAHSEGDDSGKSGGKGGSGGREAPRKLPETTSAHNDLGKKWIRHRDSGGGPGNGGTGGRGESSGRPRP